MTSEHATLAEALVAFQKELPSVRKTNEASVQTKSGGNYKYAYADLTDVTEIVVPLLAKHGLSFTSRPTIDPESKAFVLIYRLQHQSGEADEGVYPLPDPARTPPQELGSHLTYARRYTLCSVTGIAPGGDDDDAQKAQEHAQRPQVEQRPNLSGDERAEWVRRAKEAATLDDAVQVWRESQSTGDSALVDMLARVCQKRKADEEAAPVEPSPAPDERTEPVAEEPTDG